MRIEVRVRVFAVSREDHDRTAELIDELWSNEEVFFKEYSNDCEIDYTVDEGIEGEDDKALADAHSILAEAREEYETHE